MPPNGIVMGGGVGVVRNLVINLLPRRGEVRPMHWMRVQVSRIVISYVRRFSARREYVWPVGRHTSNTVSKRCVRECRSIF